MPELLGPNGRPISTSMFRKEAPPPTGNAFGHWAGRDIAYSQLPGGGIVQFDLNKLTLADFRTMRDHYQVNASLAVLSFMQHQSQWRIECSDKRIADLCTDVMEEIWTGLNRSMSQANWAGFSPSVLDWENDTRERRTVINKVKDLIPEECAVNWKEIEGWKPAGERIAPKYKVYDGIKQAGLKWPIPVDNTFWYPLLMENGNYYGRHLLRPAFTSWYFSILVHLFANRYHERYGEPTPIARAPLDEIVPGTSKTGGEYMLEVLLQLRNRGVVVLPNDSTTLPGSPRTTHDYELEYLESQMRGADFERYLTRLDEEISLALFTPILLMRTADVGSYNLGTGHMQLYLWMLNAMNDDRAQYINRYILSRIADFNFGRNAPRPKIKFRKVGNASAETLASLLTALVQNDKAGVDLEELGQIAGLTLKEVRETLEDDPTESDLEDDEEGGAGSGSETPADRDRVTASAPDITKQIRYRVSNQVNKGLRPDMKISLGFKRRLEQATGEDLTRFYSFMDEWTSSAVTVFDSKDDFMEAFDSVFETMLREYTEG